MVPQERQLIGARAGTTYETTEFFITDLPVETNDTVTASSLIRIPVNFDIIVADVE